MAENPSHSTTPPRIPSSSSEETLLQLLKKEYGYYRAILELTQLESEKARSSSDFQEIRPLLKKKQILLTCIAEVEQALAPLKRHWQQHKEHNYAKAKQIQEQLGQISTLLEEILELNESNQAAVKGYLSSLSHQLSEQENTKKQT